MRIASARIPALRFAGVALGLAVLGWPAAASPPELTMLAGLDKGKWDLRIRGGGTRSVCVRKGPEFIQLQHTESGCNRFIVSDTPTEVSVQYTCPGNGYGLTRVRKESTRLVQIQSQGIHKGEPFDFSAEGRRTGAC